MHLEQSSACEKAVAVPFFIQLSSSFNYTASQESHQPHMDTCLSINGRKRRRQGKTWDPFFSFYRPGVLQSMGLQRVGHD